MMPYEAASEAKKFLAGIVDFPHFVRRTSRAGDSDGLGAPESSLNPTAEGNNAMRFMILIKATRESEAGQLPDEKLLRDMGEFNEQLIKAGVMLAGDGLQPSSKGARVKFSGAQRIVTDGPFPETKELVAGFWIWKVNSKQEAIDWVKRCPNPFPGGESEVEIRQVFEPEDLGPEFTPELREKERQQRAALARNK